MPVVTRVDDSVSETESFMIYGEGFDETSKVYISPVTGSDVPEYDEAQSLTECDILQKDEKNQCLTVKMAGEGSYNLYVTNSYGTSYAVPLNAARPQWVSTDAVTNGEEFRVIGKNMSSSSFGANTKSGVSLVSADGEAYDIPIRSVTPYSIDCVLDDVPSGEYIVYVTNDGYIWNEVEDGRLLTVMEDVYDPYEIGAALAHNFDFENVIDLSKAPYYMTPNKDITNMLQSAIDSVSLAGGGVLYIPEGEYYIGTVTLKEGVVLAGDGMDKTVLKRVTNSTDNLLKGGTESSCTGVVDIGFVVDENVILPDVMLAMGRGFTKTITSQRTVGNTFFKRVMLKTKMSKDLETDARGIGLIMGGKSHFLLEDCYFEGYYATITSSYVHEYVTIRNNTIKTVIGNVTTLGEYATIENNLIERNLGVTEESTNTQGIFMRGHSFVADNRMYNLGNENTESNDGEVICTEPYMGGLKLDGKVVSATKDTVVVNVTTERPDWKLDDVYYADSYLCITEGRGMGQYSRIKSFDETTSTIVLEDGFKVLPDTSSTFIVTVLCENATIYNNYCDKSEKGIWLYGDNIDCVVANNTGVNTEGIYIRSIYLDRYTESTDKYDNRRQIGYFMNVEGNTFTGGSKSSGICGIGVSTQVEATDPTMTYIYGVNMKNNTITKNVPDQEYKYSHEAPQINGLYVIYQVKTAQTAPFDVIRGIIIEGNTVSNADQGITISSNGYPHYNMRDYSIGDMTDNIYIGQNTFNNVEQDIVDDRK